MKTLFELLTKPITYFLFLNLALSSCTFYDDDDSIDFGICLDGRGDEEKESRSVRDFNGIELKLKATVYLQQGNTTNIEVEAQENLLPHIDTKVSGNTLIIDNDRCIKSNQDIKVYVTVPDLRKVIVNSSGKIISEGTLDADKLDLTLAGSGDIILDVNASDVESTILGSGSITLNGQSVTQQITITGSGKLEGFGLTTVDTNVDIVGSGKASVRVDDDLEVSISGSGEVRYKGNPRIQRNNAGSGRIINAN